MERTDAPFDSQLPVRVYFNLHRRRWSVWQRGRVVAHTHHLVLRRVTWRVQPSGRERVRREGKKNVHAYASGWVTSVAPCPGSEQVVRYNPYELETFVVGNNIQLRTSQFAAFNVEYLAPKPDRPRTTVVGINIDS